MNASKELISKLAVTAEVCGATELSKPAVLAFLDNLSQFEEEDVIAALSLCQREVKGRLALVDVFERACECRYSRKQREASEKDRDHMMQGVPCPAEVKAAVRGFTGKEWPQ